MPNSFFIVLFVLSLISCNEVSEGLNVDSAIANTTTPTKVCEVKVPKGFDRIQPDSNSFAFFLQHAGLKADNTIYYFDSNKKDNQSLHFAVLDISVSNKNLQQCADAIMRLRAEYFFARREYAKIDFRCGYHHYNFKTYINNIDIANYNNAFANFMEDVFINCGTYNLDEALIKRQNASEMNIGDVFIKPGSPGHAMIVVDCAENKNTKEKIFLLAQSFMPAQSIHIVKNLNNDSMSPWYSIDTSSNIMTPGYVFNWNHLKHW